MIPNKTSNNTIIVRSLIDEYSINITSERISKKSPSEICIPNMEKDSKRSLIADSKSMGMIEKTVIIKYYNL